MTELVCVGLATLDILVRPVSGIPADGTTALVDDIALAPAGTAGGCAVVASALGLKTELVSATGTDRNGQILRNLFTEEGVGIRHLDAVPEMPTSTTVLLIQPDGERPNLHMMGASVMSAFSPASFETAKNARFLHFGGVGFPRLTGPDTIGTLEAVRAAGTFITADLISPQPGMVDFLKALLPHVDMFMPSFAEAEILLGTKDPAEAARAFVEMGAGGCIVKTGKHGSTGLIDGELVEVPAIPTEVVDTTSCGDSYCAGFITGLARTGNARAAMNYATVTASFVAAGAGTKGALTGLQQVEARLTA